MKILLVVLDGVGDRPNKILGGKTPLQAANSRALNNLARGGVTGLINIAGGAAPESDSGVFSLLGCNPTKLRAGRGAVEAIGAGIQYKNGWLALRANFATCKNDEITDRRVGRDLTQKEAQNLEKELNEKIRLKNAKFQFKATEGHRGVLVIKAKGLTKNVGNTDPAYSKSGEHGISIAARKYSPKTIPCKPLNSSRSAKETARLVNEFTNAARRVLEESKVNKKRAARGLPQANCLLLRDAETKIPKPPREALARVRNWALLADMPLEVGIGKIMKLHVKKVPLLAPGQKRVKETLALLKKHAGVYVHLKGPDLFGHDGNALGKTESIKRLSSEFFEPLLKKINLRETRIAVTADHATPCELKTHSGDPVPLLIAGANVSGYGSEFNEKACSETGFKIPGFKLTQILNANSIQLNEF